MKNAFIDANGVLKAWGYVDSNAPGDTVIPVSWDFYLEPGKWKWDGATWQPYP